ncbi:MFS transporter [Nocardia nova]|uniref:MFS transporter n=1 Tax=Nocardia nova TaxID=37330 RepID=UPI0037B9BC47
MSTPDTARAAQRSGTRRPLGLALFVIATAQLMVVLDSTITNIALPSMKEDLGLSSSSLAWVVNAYILAFGGLLLVGGRAGDLFGRKRVFGFGIALFTLASLIGGVAPNGTILIIARVAQGVGAAIAAPTALSLIATTFPEGKSRNQAMGVYAAMSGVGSTVGLLLGGVLTEYLDWRWVFFVNVPIGLAVLAGTKTLDSGNRVRGRLDGPGAITGTAGLVSLVYGITRAGEHGWTDTVTLGSFAVAVVLLAVFLWLQATGSSPMLPLRLLRDRNRAGSYATMLFIGAGMFAMFYFLSLYLQQVLGYSPIQTGLAYLPFSLGMGMATGIGSKIAHRFAPRAITIPGLALAAAGMFWFSTLTVDSGYVTALLPAMLITSIGLGLSFLPMTLGAVAGVGHADAGIASALLNTAQQIGGAIGLAVLATVSTRAADSVLPDADIAFYRGLGTGDGNLVQRAAEALTHGYTAAFTTAGILLLVAMVIAVVAVNGRATGSAE